MVYKRKSLEQTAWEYREIVSYLATVLCSPDAARGFMDEFEHQLDLVCDMSELYGLSRMKELAVLGYRPMRVKNYVALYKVEGRRRGCISISRKTMQSWCSGSSKGASDLVRRPLYVLKRIDDCGSV